MRWSEQITLIALGEPEEATNEHGFPIDKPETAVTVFADKKSVGHSEFYKASQAGYSAEMKFDVWACEYGGQKNVEYPVASGKRYRVLRAYIHKNGEFIELTLVDLPEAQKAQKATEKEEGGGENGEI